MKSERLEFFTVQDSVNEAVLKSTNLEMKAELYLATDQKNVFSKEYSKSVKYISKIAVKRAKLLKKNRKKQKKTINKEIEKIEESLATWIELKEKIIQSVAHNNKEILNTKTIAKGLIIRYRGGMMIKDAFNRILNRKSSYGRFVRTVYKDICPESIWKKVLGLLKIGNPSNNRFKKDRKEYWKDKEVTTKKEAIQIEHAFILYILSMALDDFSEDEMRQLLDEISAEIKSIDSNLAAQIKELQNNGNILGGGAKVILQIIRLSIGKGIFMNASVKITNIVLRFVVKKGMTYPQNAAFRKMLARYLGKGRINIYLTVAMFIPDVFDIFHRRDRANVITAIFLLNQMRSDE